MGDAALSALLQVVFDRLASPILKEFGLIWGVEKELKKLSRTLLKIRSLLNDAEERQIKDEAVRIWLRDLKDVAYDADDVLDEFSTEILRSKVEGGIQKDPKDTMQQVCNFISSSLSPNQVFFRTQIAYKINEIRERLDEIASERDDLHLREGLGETRPDNRVRRNSSSLVYESDVFGRGDDRERIVDQLVSDGYGGSDVSVIAVVGMGGLGKTTLAQLVYNDKRVENHFEIRAWVCVSEDFDVRRITKGIIESAGGETCGFKELDPIQRKLEKILSGKRFLLVLDDVWSENGSEWDVLRAPLRVGAKGSKIIVTTRSEKVSRIMSTGPSHLLKSLSNDDCWLLFKQKAFVEESLNEHSNLVAIGKKIVEKCKGSPLAAKTLGGLLQCKRDEGDWDAIWRSEIWELPDDENDILPALRVSYHHLPAHLKQCFAFCSIFPKDFVFEKERLVQIWMGEGFIQSKGRKQIEDIGREYFNDLLSRSFFQYSHDDYSHKLIYKMHDLIHDLAETISGYECFRLEDQESCNIPKKARHLSFCKIKGPVIFESFYDSKSLRTLILPQHDLMVPKGVLHELFLQLQCFRVLDLSGTNIIELPNSIVNLKHLRFLDLSGTLIERLPESVCSLYNLQVLKLIDCQKLLALPNDIRNLINLRHLTLDLFSKLISMPPDIGRLTSLQTLSLFVVGKESGCEIGELKKLTNLRGKLCISELQNVVNAKVAELKDKQCIYTLGLLWSDENVDMRDPRVEEVVLEDLQPHTNLKHLQIWKYGGESFPSWIGNPLFSNLVHVVITECGKCKTLPPLGQLPLLRELHIGTMNGVKHLGHEFCGNGMVRGFPSLERLKIMFMSNLEEWRGVEEGELPHLRELSIEECPKLKELPHLPPTLALLSIRENASLTGLPRFPSLRRLQLECCNEMILRSISYLTSLFSLRIYGFKNLKSLHNGLLQPLIALKELNIYDCDELNSLMEDDEWNHLPLERFSISGCPKITSLLKEELSSSLKYLRVAQCDNLVSLPKSLQNLKSLEVLSLWGLPQLTSLPEGLKNLSSLRRLEFFGCHQLTSFPEDGLPATLQSLSIFFCPLLKERSQKERGKDWLKISHIPNISIDGEQISQN